jgi:hypothetical protein
LRGRVFAPPLVRSELSASGVTVAPTDNRRLAPPRFLRNRSGEPGHQGLEAGKEIAGLRSCRPGGFGGRFASLETLSAIGLQHLMNTKSRGLMPGGPALLTVRDVPRAELEDLLRSWFAWFEDRSRIDISPAGSDLKAELRVRRWKTKADLIVFRWRNADSTRASFDAVDRALTGQGVTVVREWTKKTKKPRSINVEVERSSVLAPATAVGLCLRAFKAAGIADTETFDVKCGGHVRREGGEVPLVPLSQAFEWGKKVGQTVGRLMRHGR